MKEEVVEMDEDDLEGVIRQSRAHGSTVAASFVPVSAALSSVEAQAKKALRKRQKSPAPKSSAPRAAPAAAVNVASAVEPNSPRHSVTSKRSRTSGVSKNGQQAAAVAAEDLEDAGPLDAEMAKVQEKLGGQPQVCLRSLDVGRFLQGEKLGVRVVSVSRLHLILVRE